MLDRQHWPDLDAENQAELLAYLGTATCPTSHAAADGTWVITHVDSNDYNGVVWARFSPAEADYSIPQLVNLFREQARSALWQLDAASQPPDIGQRFRQDVAHFSQGSVWLPHYSTSSFTFRVSRD